MLTPADTYFMNQEEPTRGCLLFLRSHILGLAAEVAETWSYGMPIYTYRGKRFCYLWVHKKYRQPYIGFIDGNKLEHPQLLQEKRARMKILLIEPEKDVPLDLVDGLLTEAMAV